MGFEKNIYNEAYEATQRTDEVAEKIRHITGIEPKKTNDYLYFNESDERGSMVITPSSWSMLEEDLSQIDTEKERTFIGKYEQDDIAKNAYRESIEVLGKYLPQDKIQRLFPGLDIKNIESYTFSAPNIKVFVLPNETYDHFYRNFSLSTDTDDTEGFTRHTVKAIPGNPAGTEMMVDLSENKIIVLRESSDKIKARFNKIKGKGLRRPTDEELNSVAFKLRVVLIHELIHDLDVSSDLPLSLREGITEWYARVIAFGGFIGSQVKEEEGITLERKFELGYRRETKFVSILMSAMVEGGVDTDTIDKAFLASDAESRKQIVEFLVKRYGEEQADKLMGWKFDSPLKALKYLVDLESKQGSDIGRFLKTWEK